MPKETAHFEINQLVRTRHGLARITGVPNTREPWSIGIYAVKYFQEGGWRNVVFEEELEPVDPFIVAIYHANTAKV